WGQYDQIGALLLILACLLVFHKKFIFSALVFTFAFQLKPTVILFAPFFILYFLYQKPSFKDLLISAGSGLIVNLLIVLPFTNHIGSETLTIYANGFLARRNTTLVNHAFNFWAIFFPFAQ